MCMHITMHTCADTPLMLAIKFHQDKVVDFLLERGVSCNEPNKHMEYPLARNMENVTHVSNK